MVLRLYKVDSLTGKKTGKKRDYPSEEHFIKYGLETYERYNSEFNYWDEPTGTKAELCFLNESNKWEKLSAEELKKILLKCTEK